jgi:replicative DNA helicase
MIPVSIGWERALIGTALANPDTMSEAEAVLPSDLTGCHQIIWSEMIALQRRGSLGTRSLAEALRASSSLDNLGFEDSAVGTAYITELVSYRGEEMPEYVNQVISASTKRQLAQTAALIKVEAEDANIPADVALDSAETRVMGLRRGNSLEGASMADMMTALGNRMKGGAQGNIWKPTIPELQELLGFAEGEDFVIIASRPGEGKSSTLRYEIGYPAITELDASLLINMENSQVEVARSFVSMVTNISKSRIKNGELTEDEKILVHDAMSGLQRVPLYVVTLGAPSAATVERHCRYYISKHGVKRIGIDYIQLMRNGNDNKVQDITLSSGTLRAISLNFGVPVIAAAQMSRSIEQRGDDADPQLSDLRESGSLEQDSTIVIFPRNVWKNPIEQQLRMFAENQFGNMIVNNAVPVRMHIKKNRNGPVGVTKPFLFIKNTNLYRSIREGVLA